MCARLVSVSLLCQILVQSQNNVYILSVYVFFLTFVVEDGTHDLNYILIPSSARTPRHPRTLLPETSRSPCEDTLDVSATKK